MKLKTSVAAILFAFSATGVWAGDTGPQAEASQPDAAARQSSGTADEALAWQFVNGQAAGSENLAGTDQGGADRAGTKQAAMSDDQGGSDQAASSEQQSGGDQTANSEEQPDGDQSAVGEEGSDQAARLEDLDENDQAASADNPVANLKDKVVVIIPKDWKGSISDLIAALEASPDAKDIVVVQGGEPQAGNSSGEDDYTASGVNPGTKQQ